MNYKTYFRSLLLMGLGLILFQSCVKSDDFSVPPIVCQDKFGPTNHELSDLQTIAKLAPTADDVVQQDYIVEGYVSSSDESGNIFKMLFIQDKPENPTFAIEVDIDGSNTHVDFPVGAKVRINLKGLVVQEESGNVKVGTFDPNFAVGRINPNRIGDYLARVCGTDGAPVIAQMVPVEFESIQEALSPGNVNKLIKIDNVQFADAELTKSFADASATGDRNIMDTNGSVLDMRMSNFADFATVKISPQYAGSGNMTMILSRFRTTYQGYIRSIADVNLNQPRFTLMIINFENYAQNATNLTPYNNVTISGPLWKVGSFSNNKYIVNSAFNTKSVVNADFVIPVSFNGKNQLSFQSNSSFANGQALFVYWSTDYDPANPGVATLHDISNLFTISNNTGSYQSFIDSGVGKLPAEATGKGFIIFKYKGNDTTTGTKVTTNIELDNIKIQ